MPRDKAEVLQWFRERLDQLAEQYPELKTVEYQARLEAELQRQTAKEHDHGAEIDR